MTTPTGSPTRTEPAPRNRRRVLSGLLSLVVVVAVFALFLPQFADVAQVRATVAGMTLAQMGVLAVAATLNLASYGWVLTATTPGLTYPQALVVTEASTAVSNTLPAGAAVGIGTSAAMFSSWGFSASRVTVSMLVSALWNNFVKLGMPVVALSLLALQGGASVGRAVAAAAGFVGLAASVGLLVVVLRSEPAALRAGFLAGAVVSAVLARFGRGPVHGWERATVKFRRRTVLLLRARWLRITVATTASHVLLFLVLLLCLRCVGVTADEITAVEALAVFAFARLVTAVPVTPGGVGIVELALIAGLAAAGGPRVEVVAAVLVFRALTYVLPIPLGVVAWTVWRRNRSWRRPPGAAPRTDLVPES